MGYGLILSLHLFQINNETTHSLKSLALFYGYVRPSRRISGLFPILTSNSWLVHQPIFSNIISLQFYLHNPPQKYWDLYKKLWWKVIINNGMRSCKIFTRVIMQTYGLEVHSVFCCCWMLFFIQCFYWFILLLYKPFWKFGQLYQCFKVDRSKPLL